MLRWTLHVVTESQICNLDDFCRRFQTRFAKPSSLCRKRLIVGIELAAEQNSAYRISQPQCSQSLRVRRQAGVWRNQRRIIYYVARPSADEVDGWNSENREHRLTEARQLSARGPRRLCRYKQKTTLPAKWKFFSRAPLGKSQCYSGVFLAKAVQINLYVQEHCPSSIRVQS